MGQGEVSIEADRIWLRPLVAEDADSMFAYLGDAANMSFFPAPFTRAEVGRMIARHGSQPAIDGLGFLAVIERTSGELIGDCGVTRQMIDGEERDEIGYHFHHLWQGQGFATEAARAVKRYGFETLGVKELCSYMAEDHWPSRRVAERNGMTVEKTFNNPRNRDLPTVVYTLSREQYFAGRA